VIVVAFTIIKLIAEVIFKVLSLWNKAEERRAKQAEKELARGGRALPGTIAPFITKDEIYPLEEEEMAYQQDNTASVILAFLAGGVVGGALGILFAPKSGKETRDDITRVVTDATEKTGELTQEAVQKLEALIEDAKSKLTGEEAEEETGEASEVS
jgi:gas vesicle protein